jgi:hypothetical protein
MVGLESGFRCLVSEWRGHGRAALPCNVLTVQFVVNLIEAQRRDSQVNLGKPATGWPELVFFEPP